MAESEREALEELSQMLQHLLNEVRRTMCEVRDERQALLAIVLKRGDLDMLHEVADLFERQAARPSICCTDGTTLH